MLGRAYLASWPTFGGNGVGFEAAAAAGAACCCEELCFVCACKAKQPQTGHWEESSDQSA